MDDAAAEAFPNFNRGGGGKATIAQELPVDTNALFAVLMYATVSALACEFISYVFLFSRSDLPRLKQIWQRVSKKLDKQKEVMELTNEDGDKASTSSSTSSSSSSSSTAAALKTKPKSSAKAKGKDKDKGTKLSGTDKKLVQLEKEFDGVNNVLIRIKARSMFLTGIVHAFTFFWMKAHYDEIVIAKLPFEPFGFLQGFSKRNLPPIASASDCSLIFVYGLCSMAIKPNLQRLLGQSPPSTGVPIFAQKMATKWSGIE